MGDRFLELGRFFWYYQGYLTVKNWDSNPNSAGLKIIEKILQVDQKYY